MELDENSRIEADNSWITGTNTRSQPANRPGRISGSVISRMVVAQAAPRICALSSSEGSIRRRDELARRRVGRAHTERNVAADIGEQQDRERPIKRNRHGEPELDEGDRDHDAGEPERAQRGVVEGGAPGAAR